ncbi:MAG TPA: polyphosphate polymerase domain-containing protein [Clostridia bacterium]|nr:polyphosphate polymerase domain-containing protein [Clostridia bacterium]
MSNDRMQRQRFELKYLIDEEKALAIRHFAMGHLELDEAGLDKPDNAYRVSSLYLDSGGLLSFWDWVNGNRNRFKLRMRFYDTRLETPVFLEIKRHANDCILKERCGISKLAATLVAAGHCPSDDDILTRDSKGYLALTHFVEMVTQLQARPKALVSYLREAYIDPENEGVRLTLDRQVSVLPRSSVNFSLDEGFPIYPFGDIVILELKFNNRFPNWFGEMIRTYHLPRRAAAKYCEGVAALWHPQLSHGYARELFVSAAAEIFGPQPVARSEDSEENDVSAQPAEENAPKDSCAPQV